MSNFLPFSFINVSSILGHVDESGLTCESPLPKSADIFAAVDAKLEEGELPSAGDDDSESSGGRLCRARFGNTK